MVQPGKSHAARKALLGPHARSYEGADAANATRIVAALWLLSAGLSLLFLPLDPPTEALGAAGWALAGLVIGASFAIGVGLLRRPSPPSFNALLVMSYVGLGSVAVLVWLSGGYRSAYDGLYLLWLGSAMGVHPAQRAFLFLAATTATVALPLVYEGWDDQPAAELGADFLLWATMGVIALVLMTYVRGQRVALRTEAEEAEGLARADSLTGLGNRRGFDEALESELGRAKRAGSTTSVVLLDLDRLKQINDELSHLEGDRCLRQAAAAIASQSRSGDRAFRWGGDEFAVLMPDTTSSAAHEAAARIAATVASTCADAAGRPLTVAWGVADGREGVDPAELIGRADIALRAQKSEHAAAG